MLLPYDLKTETERFGELELSVTSLADLDRTIDQIFELLERTGETGLLESLCPYFGKVWPSGRALTAEVWRHGAEAFRGRRVLELGCGLALPSLAAARLGAEVVATDFHPDIPEFLERNTLQNGISSVRYVRVDWHDAEAVARAELGAFDWVIGSDVLYEREQAPALARVIRGFLAQRGGRALIADPGRPYLQGFSDEMRSLGFDAVVSTRVSKEEDGKPKDVFLLEFQNS